MDDRTLPKWPFVSTGLVVVVAIFVILFVRAMNVVPDLHIPTPTMPRPNAYDFYCRAGAKTQAYRDKIRFAASDDPHPDGSWLNRVYSLDRKAAIVRANAPVLLTLRQGFSYEYMNPPCRSVNTMFPEFAQFRDVAKLLTLDSQVKAGHGDWGGAMDSCLDAIRMGADTPRGSMLITTLVGIACQSIGRKGAWKLVDNLSAGESRAAARRMERILARQVPFADTMQEEKWSTLASLTEVFSRPGWRLSFFSGSSKPSKLEQVLEVAKGITWNKGRSLRCYSSYMDEMVEISRMPYAARLKEPSVPDEEMCEILCPVFQPARVAITKTETQNALLTITLALRAYRLEHGQYPATLAELKGSYLKNIPSDPFALKGPPKYKRTGSKYVLYSVGPDSKDDGGKAIYDKSAVALPSSPITSKQIPYKVQADSKGDIVAGVNIF